MDNDEYKVLVFLSGGASLSLTLRQNEYDDMVKMLEPEFEPLGDGFIRLDDVSAVGVKRNR